VDLAQENYFSVSPDGRHVANIGMLQNVRYGKRTLAVIGEVGYSSLENHNGRFARRPGNK
jgi:hypothetical protein